MRKVMGILVILAVLVGVFYGAKYFFGRLDSAIESELEAAATQAFGTNVTVGDVRIEVMDGSVTIEDLAIANPQGFNATHAFVFGSIEASVDFKSMSVDRVILDDARIFVEEKGGRINVQELKKSVESRVSEAVTVDESGPREELNIELFLMRGTTATLESDSFQKLAELDIDPIEMRNLRGTPDQVAGQIANRVVEEISDAAQAALVRAKAEDLGEKALDKLKELLGDDDDGDEDGG